MTNQEFVQQIDRWKLLTSEAGITLPDGRPLPEKFWPVFLGYSWSTYKKHKGKAKDIRPIQCYTAKHLRALSKLDSTTFLEEVRLTLPEFLAKY